MTNFELVLASGSPRRRELLDQIGVRYEVRKADIDESVRPAESPADYVQRLATEKAAAVQAGLEAGDERAVLGADTAVVIENRILGKPADRIDALSMLMLLSGRTHSVLSAVALIKGDVRRVRLSDSRVTFRDISRDEAERYWASGEPEDKAGAWAIQGIGSIFVQQLEGSYSGVMGLPLFETAQMLEEISGSIL